LVAPNPHEQDRLINLLTGNPRREAGMAQAIRGFANAVSQTGVAPGAAPAGGSAGAGLEYAAGMMGVPGGGLMVQAGRRALGGAAPVDPARAAALNGEVTRLLGATTVPGVQGNMAQIGQRRDLLENLLRRNTRTVPVIGGTLGGQQVGEQISRPDPRTGISPLRGFTRGMLFD
jgi:hypothetical protein